MFKKLQNKWKVSGGRLLLILITFALGGSFCGYLGRKILALLSVEKALWVLLYIIVITVLWPVCVLLISIPLGQFKFFRHYLDRISARMFGKKKAVLASKKNNSVNIAIFAGGTGTNAEKLIEFFKEKAGIVKIAVIVSNNPAAGVLNIAGGAGVPAEIIDLKNKNETEAAAAYLEVLKKYEINFIVLAGYLKKIPATVIKAYPEKIVNIHPALLPAYGGTGMYGMHVHEAVIHAGEKQSGISIHYVDEIYDHGEIIFQQKCNVGEHDTPESLANKIRALEHEWYGKTVEKILTPG